MNKLLVNLLFIVAICLVSYLLFRNLDFKEGMSSNSSTNIVNNLSTSTSNGIAGSAQNYAANIKSMTIKSQDRLLISKYRSDYENAILNLDDLINTMMLETALSVKNTDPMNSLKKLNELNSARGALNSVMKFVDSSK
jgi:hypothetical protein